MLPELTEDVLALFVFGPGTGELVVVHAPPGEWLVVDGCRAARVSYAQALLDHYAARPSVVVLTHPHADHAAGVADLVERYTRDEDRGLWPILGMVLPPQNEGAGNTADDQSALTGGVAERAVAAILSRWEMEPSIRWTLTVGDVRPLGDAMLTVLSPETSARTRARATYLQRRPVRWNDVASALLLEWNGLKLVLGSDLEKSGWRAALKRRKGLAIHRALKVPHHGSRGALVAGLLSSRSRAAEPTWIVTPFARANLPRFDAKGGVAFLHRYHSPVLLTSLPRSYAAQGGPPGEELERSQLDQLAKTDARDPARPGFPDCFVVMVAQANGSSSVQTGACSVRVVGADTRRGRASKLKERSGDP